MYSDKCDKGIEAVLNSALYYLLSLAILISRWKKTPKTKNQKPKPRPDQAQQHYTL